MGPITTLKFTDRLPVDCQVSLTWTPTGGGSTTATETIKTTRTTFFQTTRGTNAVTQAENYVIALGLDYSANIQATRVGNYVYVRSINTTSAITGSATCAGVEFYDFYYTDPVEIRTRSPYLLKYTQEDDFDSIKYNITVYEGLMSSYADNPITYSKTKQKIVPTQDYIFINLSNLLREDLTSDVNNYVEEYYTDTLSLALNESKWVFVESTPMFLGATAAPTTSQFFYAVDGYLEPEFNANHNLPFILKTNDRKLIERSSLERIYFKTRSGDYDLVDITYTPAGGSPITVDLTTFTLSNRDYIHSLLVDTSLSRSVVYEFTYQAGTNEYVATYTFDIYDECKYDTYDLVFKNKYGVLDCLTLTKKTSKTLNVSSTDYLTSIVNYNGDFDITKHTNRQMSVQGSEEWTLNTDFLPEYMNEVMTEAMLSEEMWLVDRLVANKPRMRPVTRIDSSLAYKTELNDKLVQYTVKVKMSHEKVNNIQ